MAHSHRHLPPRRCRLPPATIHCPPHGPGLCRYILDINHGHLLASIALHPGSCQRILCENLYPGGGDVGSAQRCDRTPQHQNSHATEHILFFFLYFFLSFSSLHNKRHSPSVMSSSTAANDARPAHHCRKGKGFVNPWPSFHRHGQLSTLRMFLVDFEWKKFSVPAETKAKLPPILDLNKTLIDKLSRPEEATAAGAAGAAGERSKVATTWLGQ